MSNTRNVILGWRNNILKNNSLTELIYEDMEIIKQISMKIEDHNGYPNSATLELLKSKETQDYALVIGSTLEFDQYSKADAYMPLFVGDDLGKVKQALQQLLIELEG